MPVEKIISRKLLNEPPDPLRASMNEDALMELATSIRKRGLLQPLLVVPDGDRYEIVDGHRRYIASGMAGLVDVPCRVFYDAEDDKFEIMLDGTQLHEKATPAEEGVLFLELCEKRGWSIEQVCDRFRRSEQYVNERVDLIRIDPAICEAVQQQAIPFAVAKELLKCGDPKHRAYLLELAKTHGSTARTAKYQVYQWKAEQDLAAGRTPAHVAVDSLPSEPVAQPRCIFCGRDDDIANIQQLPVHWYHKRDLVRLLEQVGLKAEQQA